MITTMKKVRGMFALLIGTFILLAPISAMAEPSSPSSYVFGFSAITSNDSKKPAPTNPEIGAAQFSMTVNVQDSMHVEFLISNTGEHASSIREVYFDDANLPGNESASFLDFSSVVISNGPGTSFEIGASPPNVPGHTAVNFVADFASQSDGNSDAGINPGEKVGFTFAYNTPQNFEDLIAALNGTESNFTVALHAGAFADGGSESFINTTPGTPGTGGGPGDPVPEPATMLLFGTGLIGLAGARRRRKK